MPISRSPSPRSAFLAAAALLLGFSAPAHAQTLVSNTGQTTHGHTACVLGSEPTELDCAQGFTTGQNSRGYDLASIQLDTQGAPGSGTLTVTVREDNGSGHPSNAVLYILTNPSNVGTGVQTFAAPGGARLNRNTQYFVHMTFDGSGTRPRWNLTANDNEDSGKARGWSIGNHRYTRRSDGTGGWEGDGGVYSTSIQIRVKGNTLAPAAPENLSATPGETEVTLTWADPGNNTITKYQYRRKTGAGAYGNWTDISGSGASTDSYTVIGLTNGTEYTFAVRAKNVGGNGAAATLTAETLPAAPTNLWPDPGHGEVTLSWTVPNDDTILRYQYRHKIVTGTYGNWTNIPNSDKDTTAHTVTGLTNGTRYRFELRAVNSGSGPASTVAATPLARPAAPANLLAAAGDGQVTLSWTNPGNNTIWKYQVSTDGGGNFTDIGGSSWTTTTYTVTGLSNGTQYRLALRAVNASGDGAESTATATPLWAAPANLSATPGDRQVTLIWTDPGDSTITKYQVSTDGGVTFIDIGGSNSATTANTVTHLSGAPATRLSNGTTYTLALRAANASAHGAASSATTRPLWPAPTNLAADPGDGEAILQWDTGDALITDYRVHWQATSSGATPEISNVTAGLGDTTTATIEDLTNGTEYTFTVQAVDKSGSPAVITGLPSNATATPAPVPDGPANLSVTARSQEVGLTWDGSADSTITKYQVSTDSGTNFADIEGSSAATTATTVTSLTNGTAYTLAVRAVNDSGPGAAPRVTATPLWPAPTGLVAAPNNGQVTLQWDRGVPGITKYHVLTEGPGNDINTLVPAGSGTKTTVTDTGLTNGAEYTFTVRAALGTDPANATFTSVASTVTATPAAALPAKPTGLMPTAGDGQVTLDWDDPNDLTLTGYDYSTDGGMTSTSITGLTEAPTSYTITGLTNDTEYTLALRADNASGKGPWSDNVTATPIAKPGAPVNFKATRGSNGGEVALTWDDPDNDTITGYEYRKKRGNRAFGGWVDIGGSDKDTTAHTVTGLSNGRQHTFELWAMNASGEGAADSDKATPLWPAPNLVATPDHGRVHLEWTGVPGAKDYILKTKGPSVDWTSLIGLSEPAEKVDDSIGLDPNNPLANGTEYTFTVWSTTAGGTQTSVKAIVKATPVAPPLPAAPTISSATPGDQQVALSWDDPDNITITKYQVRWKVKDSDDSTYTPGVDITHPNPYATPPTPPTTYTATGLTNGTTYTFEVRAGNGTGEGPASTVDAKPIAIPNAPENLSAAPGDGQVALSWDKPSNDATIGSYTYEVSTDGGTTFAEIEGSSATTTAHTVMGLTNGTEYTLALRAVNSTGNGLVATVNARPIAVPAAPTISSVTPGDGQVALEWADPDDSSITMYQVRWKGKDSDDSTYTAWANIDGSDADTTEHPVTDLTNGTEYTFALRAENASGVGAAATATATMQPAAPTNFEAARGSGGGEVALRWENPNNDTITKYQVSTDGGTTFTDIPNSAHGQTNATEYTVTGLTNGTAYTLAVRAVNLTDNSAASPDATATPLWPAPETVATPGDGQVKLTWENVHSDIANYAISAIYTQTGSSYSNTLIKRGSGLNTTIVMVTSTNNIDYTFTVQAAKISGNVIVITGREGSVDAKPVPVPAAPANLEVVPANRQAVLTWDDPGDSTITKYQYRQAVGEGSTDFGDWSDISGSSAATTTYTVTGLTNDTEYTFELRAVNVSGDGAASSVTAKPEAVPNAPENLSARAGDGQVALEWDDPSDNTIPITGYQVSTDGGTTFIDIEGSDAATTAHTVSVLSDGTDTPLTNGTQYTLAVRAVNTVGDGPASTVTARPVLPVPVPAAPAISSVKPGNRQVALDWVNSNDSTITRYQISTDDGTTFTTIEGSSAATTTHTVIVLSDGSGTHLSNGTEYTFAVRAVNASGEGLASTANATPFDNPLTGSDKRVSTFEDTAYAFELADFGFSVTDAGDAQKHVKITWLPRPNEGTLSLRGTAITSATPPQQVTLAALDDGKLTYTPPANVYGNAFASFGFRVNDGEDDSEPATMTIDVTPVNDAPTASDKTVSTFEDTAYAFAAAEFGFSDADAGDTLDHVKITALPVDSNGNAQGALSLDGTEITSITPPQQVTLAALDGGKLTYTPPADANGEAFASFGFKVNDGEIDSASAYTMTIDVAPANDAPTASDKTVSTFEDTAYTFAPAKFGFSDADAGDTLDHVKITALPVDSNGNAQGALSLDGTEITSITPPQQVTLAALDGGKLTYTPPADANGEAFASFGFKVNDGEIDSASAYTMTIDVTPMNDAPTASDKTVSTFEDTAYAFAAAEFGFSDADAGDTLDHVKITALPVDTNGNAQGTLSLDGTEITSITPPQQVTLAALDGGKLIYTPPVDADGEAFATTFSFKVNDGKVDSVSAYTMTIDVAPANDAPTASDKTVSTFEDTAYTFAPAEFGFSDADAGDTLDHVKITALPVDSNGNAQGALSLDGTEITSITPPQQVTLAALDGGKLTYTPPADANGEAFASFGFKVNDGEIDSASAYTMTIDVTPVNDAPTASDKTVSTFEDTAYAFAAAEFGFSDADAGDTLDHVKITALPVDTNGNAQGTLSLDGTEITSITPPQQVTLAALDGGKLIYTPPVDADGEAFATTFSFKVNDGKVDSVSAYTMTIDVAPANDAPTASDKTVSTFEDTAYTFAPAEFGFSDADAGDTLDHVKITALPVDSNGNAQGALSLDGTEITSITPPQQVTLAALDGGKLTYTPPADANGEAFASFGFKVNDGEIDSASAYTMTIDVAPANDAPTASDKTVSTFEDTAYAFAAAEFGFSDADAGDTLDHVKITALPVDSNGNAQGALSLDGTEITSITPPQQVTLAALDGGKLTYTPPADANGEAFASFGFKVNDGEIDSASAYTMTIDVTPMNDAPTASDKTVSTFEDTAYAFAAAEFGFSDADAGDTLDHVKITALPVDSNGNAQGTLSLDGTEITSVTPPQQVTLAALDGGKLTYTPPANVYGNAFASFGFRVNDGEDDSEPATMTIDVTPVNDAPTASDKTVSTFEDTAYAFAAAEFGFSDADAGDTLDHVKITALPVDSNGNAQGALSLDGTEITSITPPQQVTLAALDGGKLTYTPPADANGEAFASFGFKVNDGEIDSASAYTMTIDVTPMNDAPTASDKTVSTFEDTAYAFAAAEFGFSDADAGDTLDHVKITALPVDSNGNAQGTLSLDGTEITSVTPPQQVTLAALDDGKFTYTPPADANGEAFASFGFKVNDGEVDSALAYTMTIELVPVLSVSFGAAAYEADEGGAAVEVNVTLDQEAIVALTIPIMVTPRGETVAADYQVDGLDAGTAQGVAGTLTFDVGQDTHTFTIKAEDDDDFHDETVMLGFGTLPSGAEAGAPEAATLTITDDEGDVIRSRFRRLNDEILSKHALTIADVTHRAIDARMDDSCGEQAAAYTLAGGSTIYDTLQSNAQAIEDGMFRLDDVLAGLSFVLPLGAVDDDMAGVPGGPVLWGRGDRRTLESQDSAFAWDGTILTGQLGIDSCVRDDLMTGLTVSRSIGAFDYTDGAGPAAMSGEYESRMTSVHPYLGWSSPRGLSLWGTVGYGRGEIEIDDEQAGRQMSDTTLKTVATGASGPLMSDESLIAGGTTRLMLKGEASVAQVEVDGNDDLIETQTVNARRLRLALEGSHEQALASGGSLTPSLELGLRHDGGDGITGTGLELGVSLRYQDPATDLTIEGRGRVLTGQSDHREWGLGGSLRLDPGADGQGLSFSLTPTWGDTASGVTRLWEQDVAALAGEDRTTDDSPPQWHLEAELGYGLSALGGQGLLTPYGAFALADEDTRRYRLGSRFEIGSAFSLSLQGERREAANDEPDHGVMLWAELRF